jgi:hypothetical protein
MGISRRSAIGSRSRPFCRSEIGIDTHHHVTIFSTVLGTRLPTVLIIGIIRLTQNFEMATILEQKIEALEVEIQSYRASLDAITNVDDNSNNLKQKYVELITQCRVNLERLEKKLENARDSTYAGAGAGSGAVLGKTMLLLLLLIVDL